MRAFFVFALPGACSYVGPTRNISHRTLTGDKEFSMTEANKLARLAQVAYCSPDSPDVLAWSCESCVESNIEVKPGSVRFIHGDASGKDQAVVGKLKKEEGCFVAFRGSSNINNWVKDAQVWYWNSELEHYPHCDGCKVHAGFYTSWQGIRDGVNAALEEIGCKHENHDPIYITGHSLGGALAHLASFTLHGRGYKVAQMYSFESPRVGNDVFAHIFDFVFGATAPCFRITHDHDPAVHVPAENTGYTHVNTEIYFGSSTGSDYKVCTRTEDPACSNQHSNVPWDMFYAGQHCGLPAFGDGFNICKPVCTAAETENVMV